MTFKRIEKLKNFGCFSDYEHDKNLPNFAQVNILFGSNGSGKTTLSNLFYCLSKHCSDKDQLLKEYITEESHLELSTDEGKVTDKNILQKQYDLYVFNPKFISDHVYNGNVANLRSFASDIKLTNQRIEDIDSSLEAIEKRKKKFDSCEGELKKSLDSIWERYSKEFQRLVKGARLTGKKPSLIDSTEGDFEKARKRLDELYENYKKKNEQQAILDKLDSALSQLQRIEAPRAPYVRIQELLNTSIKEKSSQKIKKEIEQFSQEIERKHLKQKLGDVHEWFRKGGRILYLSKSLGRNTCPLCQTDIEEKIDELINQYSDYFSNQTAELLDSLKEIEEEIESIDYTAIKNSFLVIIKDLEDLHLSYQFDLESNDNVKNAILNLHAKIDEKKKTLNESVNINPSEYKYLAQFIELISSHKTQIEDLIRKEKQKIESGKLDQIIEELKSKINIITQIEFNHQKNRVLKNSSKKNAEIATKLKTLQERINPQLQKLKTERQQEVSKLNAESKFVNIYLQFLGIDHFFVEREKDVERNNLRIHYKKSGRQKKDLKASLSEGEKTALAFSYFISKIRTELLEGQSNGFKGVTIVIDDPISSLDENRLYQTANLIDTFFFYNPDAVDQYPAQTLILSHNYNFLKFLNNSLKANSSLSIQDFYIQNENPKIRNLPGGLKNYTNTYLLKLKSIMDFKGKKGPEYDVVRNYLPNNIRVVLETFLSFKLATVNDDHNRIPGLKYLIGKSIIELEKIDDYEVTIDGNQLKKQAIIQRLNYLKKISDHDSHGNISKLQDINYISEVELRTFTKNTIQVIHYLDSMHLQKAKGLVS